MATFTFSSGGLVVEVEVVEDGFGNLDFTISVISTEVIGDLRGLFFDMSQNVNGGAWSITNLVNITDEQLGENSVIDLGNGANMNGVDDAPYDIGVEIGTEGASPDDIQFASFTLSGPGNLTIADIEDMGLRINSVGEPFGDRSESLKLVLEDIPPTGAQPITLTVEEEDANLALGGNEDTTPGADEDTPGVYDNTTDMATGTLIFGAGTNPLTSFKFSTNLDDLNQDTDNDGGDDDLFWKRVSDTQIIGYFDAGFTPGMEAVQIDLIPPTVPTGTLTDVNVGVKVTLLDNLLHEDPNTNIEEVLNLGFIEVEASDGITTVTGRVNIREIDDVPLAAIDDAGGDVTIDETAGLQDGAPPNDPDRGAGADPDNDDVLGSATLGATALTVVFGGVSNPGVDAGFAQYALSSSPLVTTFGSSVGADSEGATTVLSLAVADSDSDLSTTDGKEIKLFIENGLIVGRYDATTGLLADVDAGDPAAFAIAIGQDGNLAVVQYVSLYNPTSPINYDEPVDLAGKVNAVVTVTDGDGDEATTSTAIGDQIFFEDDGPEAAIGDGGGDVTIDETAGRQDGVVPNDPDRGTGADPDNDDVLGTATLGGTALTTVFVGVANPGSDLTPTQYALSTTALVSTAGSDAGADEEGATTVLSLEVADSDSELSTTDGAAIKLFLQNGLIVGRYDDDGGGTLGEVDADDPAAFAIAIGQDGNIAIALYVSLNNPTFPDDFDEAVDLAGKVNAVVTVTDGDGDIATASTGIGDQIYFEDDGPEIGPIPNGVVDFAAGDTVEGGLFFDAGEDGPEDADPLEITDWTDLDGLNEVLSADGKTLTYIYDGSDPDLTGALYKLEIDGAGGSDGNEYLFTVLQDPPLDTFEVGGAFESGPPQETITVAAENAGFITFDGTINNGQDPDNGEDFLNPDQLGFGVFQGQSSNINPFQGFEATFTAPDMSTALPVSGLKFKVDQTGNTDHVIIDWTAQLEGGGSQSGTGRIELQQGNNAEFVIIGISGVATPADTGSFVVSEEFTSIDLVFRYDDGDPGSNESVRVEDFAIIDQAVPPDEFLQFTVEGTDGDGDAVDDTFQIGIDGDSGGVSFPPETLTLSETETLDDGFELFVDDGGALV